MCNRLSELTVASCSRDFSPRSTAEDELCTNMMQHAADSEPRCVMRLLRLNKRGQSSGAMVAAHCKRIHATAFEALTSSSFISPDSNSLKYCSYHRLQLLWSLKEAAAGLGG